MIVTFVHVWVKPEFINDFIDATIANHNESVKETGNLRFDLLRDADEDNKFVLYEAYESEEAAATHKNTPHYHTWRNTVADWMAKPREGKKHTIVCPNNKELW